MKCVCLCVQLQVPVGHVWLEGDNRDNSTDSRSFGAVPQALIRGRVICRVWPLQDIQIFTNDNKRRRYNT